MKLTTRFLILTGVLCLTVVLSLAIAYWGIGAVNREVRNTYGEITGILARLDLIKRNFEHQMQGLEGTTYHRVPRLFKQTHDSINQGQSEIEPPSVFEQSQPTLIPFDLERMRQLNDEIRRTSTELNDIAGFLKYAGTRTSSSIEERIRELASQFDQCYAAIENDENDELASLYIDIRLPFEELHLFVESLEGRMLEDLETSLDFAEETQFQVNLVLLACLVIATLVVGLVFLLQGRWFNQPMNALRIATTELRKGNLEYRVPVHTRDELGVLAEEINDMASTIIDMQDQLLERERMAAVGEMMRRIVHNLRNPLAGIRSLAELTRSELSSDSVEFESQSRIVRTVDQFESWLEEVLHSTRTLEVRAESVHLDSYIRRALEPQQATAEGRSIQLRISMGDAPTEIPLDPVHFQHALVALVANAIEACSENGEVQVIGKRIDASTRILSQFDETNGSLPVNGVWELTVEDSGPGVEEEWRHRIFEPYFTMKRHGTGIGLAVVRNVVRAHHGVITVDDSELGGACFRVTLPW